MLRNPATDATEVPTTCASRHHTFLRRGMIGGCWARKDCYGHPIGFHSFLRFVTVSYATRITVDDTSSPQALVQPSSTNIYLNARRLVSNVIKDCSDKRLRTVYRSTSHTVQSSCEAGYK
ncbi:Uncharacterized protein HZ326_27762 [Fusarium oxysporum f. sp. albedinis]|nr:Uncharacterized protein HZ326_27762 [Fusarium oxysporum f. sp. albedinis]